MFSIVGGPAITEGGDVTFIVTSNPAPTKHITFFATVSQDGNFTSSDGQTSSSIGPSGSATFTVSTVNDDAPGSGATPTYTEFWAPYLDLIAKVETTRNHPPPLRPVLIAHRPLRLCPARARARRREGVD